MRRLFDDQEVSVTFERGSTVIEMGSSRDYVELLTEHSGPAVAAKHRLRDEGAWEAFGDEVCRRLEEHNLTPGARWRAEQAYVIAVVERRAET